MLKIKLYIQDVFNELINKVSWPSWTDLQSSSIIVGIASLIIAFIVYLMDTTFSNLMNFIYSMFY